MLPEEKPFPNLIPHFPTRWQAVVFRNYGVVPAPRIAAVLATDTDTVEKAAFSLGLEKLAGGPDFRGPAYLTVLRSNWHLLNYRQLMLLLEIDEPQLHAYLYEDDFAFVKLGDKPYLADVRYEPLSEEQRRRTEQIGEMVRRYARVYRDPPFAFCRRFAANGRGDGGFTVKLCPDTPRLRRYVHYLRAYYDLTAFKGKTLLCRVEDRPDWGEEDYVLASEGGAFVVDAASELGALRGLQAVAERPEQEHSGKRCTFLLRDRIVYSYFATCGDVLLRGGDCCYPDGLLAELARRRVNGIWLHGLLRQLSPFPWDSSYSEDYEKRRANLNDLIERAAGFGIRVWLYLNEPRSMPLSFFQEHPELLGGTEDGFGALCTSKREVKEWLREATRSLAEGCPGLGGVISITMSENLTNCYSRTHSVPFNCPYCKDRSKQEVAAEVNRLLAAGLHEARTGARLIAWTWGWSDYLNWDRKAINEGLAALDQDTAVMCTSEDSLRVVKGDTVSEIIDYTMSNVGPSEKSAATFAHLKQMGRSTYAKVQVNNSWECAAVPFIPVFNTVETHIRNLLHAGVSGMLLSWTLGGYPSFNLDLTAAIVSDVNFRLDDWYARVFGADAVVVKTASQQFSRAFAEFPFSLDLLYKGPQNAVQNLLYDTPTGLSSTMVCYPFDDLRSWGGPFKTSALIRQFKRLTELWRQGVAGLKAAQGDAARQVALAAEAVYRHFNSAWLQMRFISLRDSKRSNPDKRAEILGILCLEFENTAKMLELQSLDSTIGYEASNQYFYYENTLLEKLVNVEYVKSAVKMAAAL